MLLDGRNRREAAKLAGIIPPVIVTEVDPHLAVLRSNYGTRDVTPGQKAMAFAMSVPSDKRGMGALSRIRDNEMSKTEKNMISIARYIRRNNPIPEGKDHPQICHHVMDGLISLTEAHEITKRDVAIRESEEAIRQANAAKLDDVRVRYPNLAAIEVQGPSRHLKRKDSAAPALRRGCDVTAF